MSVIVTLSEKVSVLMLSNGAFRRSGYYLEHWGNKGMYSEFKLNTTTTSEIRESLGLRFEMVGSKFGWMWQWGAVPILKSTAIFSQSGHHHQKASFTATYLLHTYVSTFRNTPLSDFIYFWLDWQVFQRVRISNMMNPLFFLTTSLSRLLKSEM